MSRSSNLALLHRAAWTLALLAAGGATADAVDKSQPATRSTTPAPVESMARIPEPRSAAVLRCWQEGRLIFESSGVSFAEGLPAATALKGSNGRVLQLLDLRQGLCILERTHG
jgi:hypothetical protein